MTIRCIAVDDNEKALRAFEKMATHIPYITLIGLYTNSIEAHEAIIAHAPELVVVDIDMPDLSGIELIKLIKQDTRLATHIIIATSHVKYGKDGFDLKVTDFLLKPYPLTRLKEALHEVYVTLLQHSGNDSAADSLFHQWVSFKSVESGMVEKMMIQEIEYIQVKGNYIYIHTGSTVIQVHLSLDKAEAVLPKQYFLRIRDDVVVPLHKIVRYHGTIITMKNEQKFRVGRAYKNAVDALLRQ